jgi:hypothetical protein
MSDRTADRPADALLGRIERRALILAAGAAIVAAIVPGGGLAAAVGVLGGALLVGASYWAIKRGVGGLVDAVIRRGDARRSIVRSLSLFVARYALLGLMAYVMIARLRLPPVALLAGASVMAIAAAIELVRGVTARDGQSSPGTRT